MKSPLPFRSNACAPHPFIAALAVACALLCITPQVVLGAQEAPNVHLSVLSEGEALAKGFEEGFNTLNGPIFITYERQDRGFATLAGIRSLRAAGSTVIIRTDRGPTLILPASSILVITDERPLTP